MTNQRKSIGQILRWSVMLASIVLLAVVAISRWDSLTEIDLTLSGQWLVPASLTAIAASLLLVFSWRELLTAYGSSLDLGRAVRIWSFSQTTRYLPSGLVPIAARSWLAAPTAVPRLVVGMSVVVETATLLGWTVVATAIWAPGDWIHPALRIALGLAALAGLVTLPFTLAGVRLGGRGRATSWVSKRIAGLLGRFGASEELRESLVGGLLQANHYGVWRAAGLYGTAVAARLASFALLAAAVLPLGAAGNTASAVADTASTASDIWLVVGASAVSLVVGMVGITPAGLGVRETLLTTLLTARFGLGDALAFSVALRAWEIVLELLFLAVAAYVGRRSANTLQANAP